MTDTVASELTPPATGAIAVLAVVGPRAWAIVGGLFRPKKLPLPESPAVGRTFFGTLAGDEVIVAVRREAWIEIHCHGGRAMVRLILDQLAQAGAPTRDWRTLLPDRLLAHLHDGLSRAPTFRTASILLEQLNGTLTRVLARVLAGDDAARTELLQFAEVGRHLVAPWRVVLVGPPNVGKSSLMNALAGYARSLVAPVAGTTRDLVTATLAFDGWPVELADTAGLRAAGDDIEAAGVALARQALAEADLAVWVQDATLAVHEPDAATAAALAGRTVIRVANKTDLAPAPPGDFLPVSAVSGAGIVELAERIAAALVPAAPPPGTAVPYPPSLIAALARRGDLLAALE